MFLLFLALGLAGVIVDEQFGGQNTLGWVFICIAATLLVLKVALVSLFAAVATSGKRR